MAYDEKQRERIYKYRAEKYTRVNLDISAEDKQRWKAAAEAENLPLNTFIRAAVEDRISAQSPGPAPETPAADDPEK